MICQRCGVCCVQSLVVVIKPEYVTEKLSIDKLPADAFKCLEGEKDPCPYFTFEDNKAICRIHHYEWYEDMPCFSHGQIESNISNHCRTGDWMLEHPDAWKSLINRATVI